MLGWWLDLFTSRCCWVFSFFMTLCTNRKTALHVVDKKRHIMPIADMHVEENWVLKVQSIIILSFIITRKVRSFSKITPVIITILVQDNHSWLANRLLILPDSGLLSIALFRPNVAELVTYIKEKHSKFHFLLLIFSFTSVKSYHYQIEIKYS